ncbi:ABC transporter transmembrane domain-containing protein [Dokdonella sp.]|uniref:ABC transporter transmembrane domain-containing protein n=1 Tax=Dokdonella sp. TaxID=2291710 RepID=UPI0031BBF0F5|nr:ABC transporter transmembrane domain-containing protein [Dokdonella sp.]
MAENPQPSPRQLQTLRRLLPYLRRYRGLVAGWLGFLAVSSTATLVLPQAVRIMIDHGFTQENAAAINTAFLGLFVVAVVLAVATAARFFFVSLLGERVAADLRRALYDHLLGLDQAFFERTRGGELVSRLAADTELVQTVVGSTASVALRSMVTLIGGIVLMITTSPRLAGYVLLMIPAVVLPIVVFGRRVARLSRESQDRIADTSAIAGETLTAMHTVQAYTREPQESARYAAAVLRALETARRRIAMTGTLTALVIVLVFGAITLVLWAGAKSVIAGSMAVGVLSQFVLYAVLAAGSVGALSEVWGQLLRAGGALGRIGELLDTRAQIHSPVPSEVLATPVRGEIRFRDVTFHYPSRPERAALEGFNLTIRPGETVALVGPSGAGKSTVFQLLLRFHDPQRGHITLDGSDIRRLALADLRGAFALVPQDAVLFGASAGENIGFGRDQAGEAQIAAAARMAEAHEFIDALPERYATYLGERGVRLSGGQQQRIAIARAVLRDAPVLLLDEATSSLDAQSEHLIQQAFERLMHNRTTVVIAHRLATVQRADRIVVLDGGRIIAEGTHAELVRQGGLYAELARLQFAA